MDIVFYYVSYPNHSSFTVPCKYPGLQERFRFLTLSLKPHHQVRAAEDVLSLTRILKETWLFGKLQTVGTSEAEKRADAAAVKVAEGLAKLNENAAPAADESVPG